MPNYCVNKLAQPISRDHEVHNLNASCPYAPAPVNQSALGWHADCRSAVSKAKTIYTDVNGCYYCCRECHTT